jgi:hypothetical protein
MKTVNAYCLAWHINQSDAFYDLLVNPLRDYVNIRLKTWDGKSHLEEQNGSTLIFCYHPPPLEMLCDKRFHLIWIPMWDQAQYYTQAWWANLPKSLRIIAFSKTIAELAYQSQVATLCLTYFKDPSIFPPLWESKTRIALYWNRRCIVSPEFLAKFCKALQIDKLIFRGRVDPCISESLSYQLPERLGDTLIENINELPSRETFWSFLNQSNVFIAPRLAEGVGMTFLEALAQGSAVFAFNGSTMNEYIDHGYDGYLLNSHHSTLLNAMQSIATRVCYKTITKLTKKELFLYPITKYQNWQEMSLLDIAGIGHHAREKHVKGYMEWMNNIGKYAKFILEW